MMNVTIYHNPGCGTSRNTLAMIRQSGVEPTIVEYLTTPPSREKLVELIAAMGIPVRALLREKGTPYKELELDDPKWTDDELLDFMIKHPLLINRPIVVTPNGVKLCRPSVGSRAGYPPERQNRAIREGGRRGRRSCRRQSLKADPNGPSRIGALAHASSISAGMPANAEQISTMASV
jgi:arsenate reductase